MLTLRAPAGISKKALVFSDGDQRKLLGRLPDPPVPASEPSVIASCDRRKAKGHRWRLHLSILLTVGSGVNPDLLLVRGIRANPEPLPGAAAEVQDPLAEVRSASLLAARAAAEQAKGGAKQKRPRPPNQSGYTPDQQHQKTVEATPLVV